ncbi:MAG: phosphatase PAP2 family protein, partial [Bacilli bacterium]|nr:phosphatase PAP2 family protein [Bacilli bacterium]
IIAVGCFYAVLAIIYVLFEKVVINYRPILVDGELETSFPSSHTLMAICVCMSAVLLNKRLWKNDIINYINISILVVMALIVFGRLMAGVHWFSDILGGIIISAALVQIFHTVLVKLEVKKEA